MLIGVSGRKRSGKSTFARILREFHGFKELSFASRLKRVALDVGPFVVSAGTDLGTLVEFQGWEFAKDEYPEVREFLQRLGTSMRSRVDEDVWVTPVMWEARDLAAESGIDVVIADVRFPNELAAVKRNGGWSVRLDRPSLSYDDHVSETALDDAVFDFRIANTGDIGSLRLAAADVLDQIIGADYGS